MNFSRGKMHDGVARCRAFPATKETTIANRFRLIHSVALNFQKLSGLKFPCLSPLAKEKEREGERDFPERVNRAIKNKIKLPAHMVQNYGKGRRSIDFFVLCFI